MIKVSVLYPNIDDKNFDMEYYCNKHIAMVKQILGPTCKCIEVEQGLSGAEPNLPAPYTVMAHLYFESLEIYWKAMDLHRETMTNDVPNYTDIQPTIQISEVII